MKLKDMLIFSAALFSGSVWANSEKVTSVDIYNSYYSAQGGKADYVRVYNKIDALLMSNKKADYEQASQIVRADPGMVTPMTMAVLSARAYDMNLRDESVFWYYASTFRLMMLDDVLDISKTQMAEYSAPTVLLRQFVMPYAMCDFDKQRKTQNQALEWTKANPYQALLLPQLKSKQADRKKAVQEAEHNLDKWVKEQQAYIDDPKTRQELLKKRKELKTDERFCW